MTYELKIGFYCFYLSNGNLKKLHVDSSQQFSFDYSSLQQKHPELKNCRFFRPEPKLLSMIWEIVLQERLPSLKQVRTLKQSGLGKLIS